MSDSTWNDPRITAYVLDELSEDDRQAFEAELAGNAELEAAVAEARNVTGQLEDLFAVEETPTLEPDRRSLIVTPVPNSRSWRTPMIALATAASLLMLIGGPMWFSRQDAMIVGQTATDTELETYGKEAAKGQAAEGMLLHIDDAAQTEFVPGATSGPSSSKRLGREGVLSENTSGSGAAPASSEDLSSYYGESLMKDVERNADVNRANDRLADKKNSPIRSRVRSRLENEEIQSLRRGSAPVLPAIADSAPADAVPYSRRGGLGGAAPKAETGQKSVTDSDDTFRFEGRRTNQSSSLAVGDSNGDGAIDESDTSNVRNPVIISGFAEAAPKRTPAFTPQGVPSGENPSPGSGQSAGATVTELREAQVSPRHQVSNTTPRIIVEAEEQAQTGFVVEAAPMWDRKSRQFKADQFGRGPGNSGDKFEPITDNPFKRVAEHAMSTFSVDVDTASYSKTRDFLARAHQLPRPDAVRIEELINYFNYDYQPPTADDVHPFTTHTVVTSCPWNPDHRLARIALKGKVIEKNERPRCNLVFLLDTSGSMNQPNKLPLVVEGMQMLLKQLNKKDRVAITVYAGSAGLVLDSTPAKKKKKIRNALTQLNAGGSTNGGAGIALAYQTARDNFISDGVNRVILCTDGDFNVGTTGTDALVRMVEQEAKGGIFLSVLGFGMGNHNDAMLEQISGRGNGNYAFIDNKQEARKVLVDQTSATLVTIAKDVKLQIEFNPKQVASYRLIGYENRVLAKEDFNDDKKDAGEIGAGHAVTALYEIVPAGTEADESRPAVDALKYQSPAKPTDAADSDELMTLKLRYKAPDGDTSTLVEFPVADETVSFGEADKDVRFAAAVAGFGMQLRRSDYKGTWTLSDIQAVAEKSKGEDQNGLRSEFIDLVRKASELMGQE